MTETEILKLAEAYWEADKRLTFQSFGEIYVAAFRRGFLTGFSHGETAQAERTLNHFKADEVSGVPV